jgi:hypothetical protein
MRALSHLGGKSKVLANEAYKVVDMFSTVGRRTEGANGAVVFCFIAYE